VRPENLLIFKNKRGVNSLSASSPFLPYPFYPTTLELNSNTTLLYEHFFIFILTIDYINIKVYPYWFDQL